MSLTQFAIDRNRIFFSVLFVILIAGMFSYVNMPRNEDPGFIVRIALVQTFFPGASPERVEMLVTDKLEKVIQEIPELDFISSQSEAGVSIIYVFIRQEYTNLRPIWDKLRRKVDRARQELPDGVIGPTVDDEFGDVFGSLIAITGDGYSYRELREVADEVRDELLLIEESAKVEIFGDQQEQVFVVFDNARLADLGLSPAQLQRALEARNIILPGGDISTTYENILFEPTGNFESIEDLRRTIVTLPGINSVIRLEDVLEIKRGYVDPPETIVRHTGEPALILGISLKEGGNIIRLGNRIRAVLERARQVYPVGVDFDAIQFQADIVQKKIADFVRNLVFAVILVTLIMLLALGFRTGLIVASLIPTAIISSFLAMRFFDIGLDQMSLAALIIALGMLVDNAIVMSESITVQMKAGKPVRVAAIDSARELWLPLLISSLTTAAAFLPIFLAESDTGEYTAPLFKVVTITLLCSWFIALTLIPTLCVAFLKIKERGQNATTFDSPGYIVYRSLLLRTLKKPWISLATVAVVFIVIMQGFAFIPNIFFPENDRPTFSIELELPVGTPIQRTNKIVAALEQFMSEELQARSPAESGLTDWASFIGEGAPRFQLAYEPQQRSPQYAFILCNVSDLAVMQGPLFGLIEDYVLNNFPDANVTIRPLSLGPSAWPPIEIRISGRDTDRIFALAETVKIRLASIPGTRQITDDWGPRTKKIAVNIDDTRARLAGISHQDIAISMQAFLSGLQTTEYREGNKLIPVVLRSRADQRMEPARLATMNVYSQATGESVPLSQVATAELVWQPGVIMRRNRQQTVTVESLVAPGFNVFEITEALRPWLEAESARWPFGYSWEFGGEIETSGEADAAIGAKLPIALMIIVLLLVIQFNSIRRTLIVLLTIPLALMGVVIGLLVVRSYFGFMTLLGIISLAGIVINNAIVLLDRVRIEIEEKGLEPAHAVILAAQQRLRPILLTTATTIGGLMPLWLGGGPMWEPMAISIIFGLFFATILTLGVVPLLYAVFYRLDFNQMESN